MKVIATPVLRSIICLILVFHAQTGWSDVSDESWSQVFNFQLKLAEQGNVKAQYILGEMYEQGRGAEKNLDTAILWYRKAEQNGHKKAANRIATIQENRQREAQDKVRAESENKRREEEKARQLVLQKQQAEAERRRAEAERIQDEKLARIQAAKQAEIKEEETKLSPEELAQKIKESQERALEIARQNAQRQQQAADAELRKYRASLLPAAPPKKPIPNSVKYQDPFE